MIRDKNYVNEIIENLKKEKNKSTTGLLRDLKIQTTELKKLQDKQQKLDNDYFNGLSPATYNRLSEQTQEHIDKVQVIISNIEREIDKMNIDYDINMETVIEALTNFNELFDLASNEEKRALLKALIKRIEMEPNRKDIKRIVFWFSDVIALPQSEVGRTVSQIVVKQRVEVVLDKKWLNKLTI